MSDAGDATRKLTRGEASFNASLTARQPVSHTRNGDTEATLRAAGRDQLAALIVTGISDRSIID